MFPSEPLPDRIGSYKVIRRLPSTGSAEVVLGRSDGPRGFQRECVLKLMVDTSEGSGGLAEDLAREAAILARLNHPAIVRVFDFFEHGDKLVLVLEHVSGTTLEQLVSHLAEFRQTLSDAAVFYLGSRLAGALAVAHAATDEAGVATPIIHRNLSPENVLIGHDGDVRLAGFGVGKILGRTPDTAIGTIKGTPGYMAPEQARGELVTTKTDVFGLGLLLWSLLSGKRPPSDGSWPRRLPKERSDLPREVIAIIEAALDPSPSTRKVTAREIEQWLTKAVSASKGRNELRERVTLLTGDVGDSGVRSKPREPITSPTSSNPAPWAGEHGNPAAAALSSAVSNLPPVRAVEPTLEEAQPNAAPYPMAPTAAPVAHPPPVIRFGLPPDAGSVTPSPASVATPQVPAVLHFGAPPISAPPAPATSSWPVGSEPGLARNDSGASALGTAPTSPAPVGPTLASPVASGLSWGTSNGLQARVPTITGRPSGRPSRFPVSPLGTILVSAVTASSIAIAIILVLGRREPDTKAVGPVNASTSSARTSSPVTNVGSSQPPSASAVVEPPVAKTPPPPPPGELAEGFGYLTVSFKSPGTVYLTGKAVGNTNEPLKVRCGRWFVRVGTTFDGRFPRWLSAGETIVVACRDSTRLEIAETHH